MRYCEFNTAQNTFDFGYVHSWNSLQRERKLIYRGSLEGLHSKVDPVSSSQSSVHNTLREIKHCQLTHQNEIIVPVTINS